MKVRTFYQIPPMYGITFIVLSPPLSLLKQLNTWSYFCFISYEKKKGAKKNSPPLTEGY